MAEPGCLQRSLQVSCYQTVFLWLRAAYRGLGFRISKPFNFSLYLLLPLISQGVSALIRHLLQLSNLLLFALADDLGFPQYTLNCKESTYTNTQRAVRPCLRVCTQMDTHTDTHTVMLIDALSVNQCQ